jgi:hypothetical protein
MSTFRTTDKEGTEVIITGPSLSAKDIQPPSNKEIHAGIKDVKQKLQEEKPFLSPQGQNIVEDATEVADASAKLLKEKNKEERFQKLFLMTKEKVEKGPSEPLQEAVRSLMSKATGMGIELRVEAADLQAYLRGSIYNLLMSVEYRQLVFDFFSILRDLTMELEKEAEDVAQEFDQSKAWHKGSDRPQGKGYQYWATKSTPGGKKEAKPQAEDISRQRLSDREEQHIEMIRFRLNEFLKQLRSKKEYQALMENFFKYSAEIYNTFKDLKDNPPPEIKDLQKLIDNMWEILGDFAEQKLVQRFRKDLNKFFCKLADDKDIAAWWYKAKDWIMEALKKPDVAETEDSIKLIKDLIRTGRKVTEKYRGEIDHLYDSVVQIFDSIKDDKTLNNFGDTLTQLAKTLALNRKGDPDPYVIQESFSQISTLLMRIFNGYLVDLPLQKVEIYSADYDVVLQDIKTEGTGFAPDSVELATASKSNMILKGRDPSRSTFRISLKVENIAPEFRDFSFFFRHKTFPSYEDVGRAEYLKFDGNGLSVKAIMTIRSVTGAPSRATLDTLYVNVDGLSLKIGEQTKHQVLSTLAAPIFAEVLRGKIEESIWRFLRTRLQEIIVRLNVWFQQNYLGIESFGDVFKIRGDQAPLQPPSFPASSKA